MMHTVRVSLVIPTLNGMPLLEDVLAAVDRQPGAAELEKVAVDSGSKDGTVECLERHGFQVRSINKVNFNHGSTRDLGIAATNGEVIVLLTQDAVPADEQWLPSLLAVYADSQVAAAYCKQLPRDDCNPFIARRLSEWTAGRDERVDQRLPDVEFEQLEPMERLQLCAYDNVAGSVRRSVWERIRFGERSFGEDVAFGKRVILAGHTIVFQPASAVVHSHNRSPKEEGKRIYCDHQNLRDLFDVHLVPTFRELRHNVARSRREFAETVDSLGLPAAEQVELHRWARSYALWAGVGMYFGGNSQRLRRGLFGWAFATINRWMHRGI